MDLNNCSIVELKSLCYDQELQKKIIEQNIKNIEDTMVRKIQEEQLTEKIKFELEIEAKRIAEENKKSNAKVEE